MPDTIRIGPFEVRFRDGRYQWRVAGTSSWQDDVRTPEDYRALAALAGPGRSQVAA